jgi:hypothetical protein
MKTRASVKIWLSRFFQIPFSQILAFSFLALNGCGKLVAKKNHSSGGGTQTCAQSTSVTVAAAYPTLGAHWNDYLENNESDIFSATETTCNGDGTIDGGSRDTEFAGASACFNAGLLRKVDLPDEASCTGLTMTDSLGALNWKCVDHGATVSFYSTGLRSNKRLADLLAATGDGWRDNSVSITKSSCVKYESSLAQWWTNPVISLDSLDNVTSGPPGATGVSGVSGVDNTDNTAGSLNIYRLDTAGAVYTITGDKSVGGFSIHGDRISFVVFPSAILKATDPGDFNCDSDGVVGASESCLLGLGHKNYLWVEGNFDGDGNNSGQHRRPILGQSNFATLRHISARRASNGFDAMLTNGMFYSRIYYFRLTDSNSDGFWLTGNTDYNVFYQITADNIHGSQITFADASNNVVTGLVSTHGGYGVLAETPANTISHMTVNNNQYGVYLGSTSTETTLSQTIASNNLEEGILSDVPNGRFAQIAATNNGTAGIMLTSNDNLFSNDLVVGFNGTDCHSDLATTGNSFVAGDSDCTGGGGGLTVTGGKNLSASFVGEITDDLQNADMSGLDGSGFIDHDSITDFFQFENWWRGWGLGSATDIFNTSNRLECYSSVDCALWDWRLVHTDSAVRNHNGAFVAGAACPVSVHGDVAITDQIMAIPNTYLLNASEIMEDGVGDDDGLCESGEDCVYSPNLGAYQGEGTLSSCTFDDDGGTTTVTGVGMYGYTTNGG